MIFSQQFTVYPKIFWISLLVLLSTLTSCLSVKKAPDAPFVFSTNINTTTPLTSEEKTNLIKGLNNQLDDSLKERITTSFFIIKKLNKPPVFDSMYAFKTSKFMTAYLRSNGFMKGEVTWDTSVTIVKNKKNPEARVNTRFQVNTGNQLKLDKIVYNLEDSALQAIVMSRESRSLLKTGNPYSKGTISAELDRLVELFRNHGYYRFSREQLYVVRDTVVAELLNPNLDPLEQLALLEKVQARQDNPTVDLDIRTRPIINPNTIIPYRIGKVDIFPEASLLEESDSTHFADTVVNRNVVIHHKEFLFNTKFLVKQNYLYPDSLYRQRNYYRTINNFNQLGAWDQATIDVFANDSTHQLDFRLKLYPGKKLNTKIDLEASRNASDVLTATSLLGIGVNFGLRDRNLKKESIQTAVNLRFGIEIGKNFIQTVQTSVNYNIFFPKLILPSFLQPREGRINNQRTILTAIASITDRRDFFALQNYSVTWGYEWSKRNPNRTWYYSPISLEYQTVGRTDSLDQLLESIPNLQNSFKNGFIISQKFTYGIQKNHGKNNSAWRFSVEESGALVGLIKSIDRSAGLFRFVKADVDYRYYLNFDRSNLVMRAYAGIGVSYGQNQDGKKESTLPVTRAFFAGGPSSMRAWGVRQLGPGSSSYLDTLNGGGYDRLGDMQLEANLEYRFSIGTVAGIKIKSALFADIGNIWMLNDQGIKEFEEGVFKLNRLYRDLAVGAGTSLRFDFEYFLIRFDWAYKIKNPIYANSNSGWFQNINLLRGQLQLGINYPF